METNRLRESKEYSQRGAHTIAARFPIFGAVRSQGPVHRVTLADGHAAWFVVRHQESPRRPECTRLSKVMHAAMIVHPTNAQRATLGPIA
jgi:hypothetical protein